MYTLVSLLFNLLLYHFVRRQYARYQLTLTYVFLSIYTHIAFGAAIPLYHQPIYSFSNFLRKENVNVTFVIPHQQPTTEERTNKNSFINWHYKKIKQITKRYSETWKTDSPFAILQATESCMFVYDVHTHTMEARTLSTNCFNILTRATISNSSTTQNEAKKKRFFYTLDIWYVLMIEPKRLQCYILIIIINIMIVSFASQIQFSGAYTQLACRVSVNVMGRTHFNRFKLFCSFFLKQWHRGFNSFVLSST